MARVLMTGATGMVGYNVARMLVADGRSVRALVRDPDRAAQLLPGAIELAKGDVTDAESIRRAISDCDVVYHIAGLPEQWLADPSTFERINVGGTRNMTEAALASGVERFIYTSTIDVFAAGVGEEYDESVIDPEPKGTYYERSKQEADRVVVAAMNEGLPAVFLHPGAVYGPGPAASPGINALVADLCTGSIPALLPGGMPVVFSEDVARGHVLAEGAEVGSRYILADDYYTLVEIATIAVAQAGRGKVPPVLPLWLARVVSSVGEWRAGIRKKPPLIPKGQLVFLQWRARANSQRARDELGWSPVSFRDEGIRRLLEFQASQEG